MDLKSNCFGGPGIKRDQEGLNKGYIMTQMSMARSTSSSGWSKAMYTIFIMDQAPPVQSVATRTQLT